MRARGGHPLQGRWAVPAPPMWGRGRPPRAGGAPVREAARRQRGQCGWEWWPMGRGVCGGWIGALSLQKSAAGATVVMRHEKLHVGASTALMQQAKAKQRRAGRSRGRDLGVGGWDMVTETGCSKPTMKRMDWKAAMETRAEHCSTLVQQMTNATQKCNAVPCRRRYRNTRVVCTSRRRFR